MSADKSSSVDAPQRDALAFASDRARVNQLFLEACEALADYRTADALEHALSARALARGTPRLLDLVGYERTIELFRLVSTCHFLLGSKAQAREWARRAERVELLRSLPLDDFED